jgi:hypothetical protein
MWLALVANGVAAGVLFALFGAVLVLTDRLLRSTRDGDGGDGGIGRRGPWPGGPAAREPVGRCHPANASGPGRLAGPLDLKLSVGGVSGVNGRVFRAILGTVVAASAGVVAWTIHATSGAACGGDRWTVKTLQDRPKLLRPQETTIHFLTTRHAPSHLPNTRVTFERHVYTVSAAVVLVQPERDRDLHVLLRSGPNQMISEAPSPACVQHATPYRRRQVRVARNQVRLCAKARVTGVAFFDFPHGQTGVAPNAIELHPILDFHCLNANSALSERPPARGRATQL